MRIASGIIVAALSALVPPMAVAAQAPRPATAAKVDSETISGLGALVSRVG